MNQERFKLIKDIVQYTGCLQDEDAVDVLEELEKLQAENKRFRKAFDEIQIVTSDTFALKIINEVLHQSKKEK